MNPTRRIGILRLGLRSTAYYLSKIESADTDIELLVHPMDFEALNAHLPRDFNALQPALLDGLQALSDCDIAIIPNVTLHETFDRIPVGSSPVQVSHAVGETFIALTAANAESAVLLGSSYTATSPYWATAFCNNGIKQMPLSFDTVEQVDEFRRRVYQGIETATDIAAFQATLETLRSATPVIIACTELSLFTPQNLESIFDCADIQIAAAMSGRRVT